MMAYDTRPIECSDCRRGDHRHCLTSVFGPEDIPRICECWGRGHRDECDPWAEDYEDMDPAKLAAEMDRYERRYYGE